MKPRIYVTRRLPARVQAQLSESFAVRLHDSLEPPPREQLLAECAGVDGLLTTLSDRVDAELLDAAGEAVRIVANYAVGYDNIDIPACNRRSIIACNTPGVLTDATAELTITLAAALSRRVVEGDRFIRRGLPWIWAPTFMLGRSLIGLTIGIVGLGRIGRRVAEIATAMGMKVVFSVRTGAQSGESMQRWEHRSLADLLAESDIVSLHCPLTGETRHLIDARSLQVMRRDAVLINTARGPIVDEDALVEALRGGVIAGAALDVFEDEPAVHPALLDLENVVLVPHLGSATTAAREAMGSLCVSALRTVLIDGGTPANAISP